MYEVSLIINLLSVNYQETTHTQKMYLELKGLCRYFGFHLFYTVKGILVKVFGLESSLSKYI